MREALECLVPLYLRLKSRTKNCENVIDSEGKKEKCGESFETTFPGAKYCPKCKATKSWGTPAVKRL